MKIRDRPTRWTEKTDIKEKTDVTTDVKRFIRLRPVVKIFFVERRRIRLVDDDDPVGRDRAFPVLLQGSDLDVDLAGLGQML
jgi:hypothetical protein